MLDCAGTKKLFPLKTLGEVAVRGSSNSNMKELFPLKTLGRAGIEKDRQDWYEDLTQDVRWGWLC